MKTEQHWRAEEARTLSDSMDSDETKRQMLEIAIGYDRMAEHAVKLAANTRRVQVLAVIGAAPNCLW
jgi:hypothetical protein